MIDIGLTDEENLSVETDDFYMKADAINTFCRGARLPYGLTPAAAEVLQRQLADLVTGKPSLFISPGPWHEHRIATLTFKPYFDLLRYRTGCIAFDSSFDAFNNIHHGYVITDAYIYSDEQLHCTVYTKAYKQSGSDEYEHASKTGARALRQVNELLGKTISIREFKLNQNGTYSPNPDYGTGKRPKIEPCVDNEKAWKALWQLWFANWATRKQKNLLAKAVDQYHLSPTTSTFCIPATGPESFDYDGKGQMVRNVSAEEFAELGPDNQ